MNRVVNASANLINLIVGGKIKGHRLLLLRSLAAGEEPNHGVHDLRMILTRHRADNVLLQAGQRAERVDHAVVQIELSFGDVTGIIRNGMRTSLPGMVVTVRIVTGACPL